MVNRNDYNQRDRRRYVSDLRGYGDRPTGNRARGEEVSYEPVEYGAGGLGMGAGMSLGLGMIDYPYYGRQRSRDYDDNLPNRSGPRDFFDRAGDEVASWFGDEDAARRREMDAGHRGRGPKNYSRSDMRILEDVSDRLMDDPHIDASDIEVSVSGGEVTLYGTVSERFAKRHAEDIAESPSGVKHVQNNFRIKERQVGTGSTR